MFITQTSPNTCKFYAFGSCIDNIDYHKTAWDRFNGSCSILWEPAHMHMINHYLYHVNSIKQSNLQLLIIIATRYSKFELYVMTRRMLATI